jgi:hypothetical protein
MGHGWRINRHARQTRNELRKQTKLLQQQASTTQLAQNAWPAPTGIPQGWYPDPSGQAALRWWNGYAWTSDTHTGETANPHQA